MVETQNQCRNCKAIVNGKFCSACGQSLHTKRISLPSILHEAFHFFTHLDHGFPFTLKQLLMAPGKMQKDYVDGFRSKHQKPFSMFFLCATVAALAIYWVNFLLLNYFGAGDSKEGLFFQKYWVFLQIALSPFYALITHLFFRRARFTYGEILVLQLYLLSFLFLVLSVIHLFKFASPHLKTRYIELPVIILYTVVTNLNFFTNLKKPVIVVLTVFSISLFFLLASAVQDFLVKSFL